GDELQADALRELLLQVEDRCAVPEQRDADGPDGRGQRRAAARERVSAAGEARDQHQQGHKPERVLHVQSRAHHFTTIDTSRPWAMTTFATVLPCVYCRTCGSARARASSSPSSMSTGTVRRARTLPFTCTGTTISSAFATSSSNDGHPAATTPSSFPSISHSSSDRCGVK